MAVAKMSKLRLIGLTDEKDAILNSLQKSFAVEIKEPSLSVDLKRAEVVSADETRRDAIENALTIIESFAEKSDDKEAFKGLVKDGFCVTADVFENILFKESELIRVANDIIRKNDEINDYKAEEQAVKQEIAAYEPYLELKDEFSKFSDTEKTVVKLGVVYDKSIGRLKENFSTLSASELMVLSVGKNPVVCAISYIKEADAASAFLSEAGFNGCPFKDGVTAAKKTEKLSERLTDIARLIGVKVGEIAKLTKYSEDFKILLDRYDFEKEKRESGEKFLTTDKTFTLEAFVPVSKQKAALKAVSAVTNAYEAEFIGVTETDLPPTYLENKKAVGNFEFVTNMYSVPKYGALDPNAVMGFFFSLFMGAITADFGYGLLLFIGGTLFAKRVKGDGGIKRLAKVLSYGGLFALPFGILFDSFLGIQVIHKICALKYGADNAYAAFYSTHIDAINSFSSVAGISVPTMLLWSMLFGALHLAAGYVLKGISEFRNGNYFDGITQGFCWAAFLICGSGLALTAVSVMGCEVLTGEFKDKLTVICLIAMLASLLLAVVFSGRHAKGFGKLTASFGSVYGLINLASDILSYARIYGLMLSGGQIAAIFTNTIAIEMLFPHGVVGIIAGVLVIIAGNLFNLAMGVLGAYIHDSRLQYVEFFGKFYEGDGELFKPLGSNFTRITYLKNVSDETV